MAKTTTAAAEKVKDRQTDTPELRGGLPEDPALGGFAIDAGAAMAAFGAGEPSAFAPGADGPSAADGGAATSPGKATEAGDLVPSVPHMTRPAGSARAVAAAPVAPVEIAPAAPPGGNEPTQCTIMVQGQVRKRFGSYQTAQKVETGMEPTNAVVVRRAFLHAYKNNLWPQLREAVRHRLHPVADEDNDPDGLFGEVPARRVDRNGVKNSVQQSFRPSSQELAVYDAYADSYHFDNRSDFLDAVLDAFLPQLPSRRVGR